MATLRCPGLCPRIFRASVALVAAAVLLVAPAARPGGVVSAEAAVAGRSFRLPVPTARQAANRCEAAQGVKPCYSGPLIDAHLHVSAPLAEPAATGAVLVDLLDRDGIDWAMGIFWTSGDERLVRRAARLAAEAQGRVVPLIQPDARRTSYLADFPADAGYEAVFRSYLRPEGPFAGIGEIPLYFPGMRGIGFGSPEMQGLFAAANGTRGIVMVHPRGGRQPQATTATEVEEALARYPDAVFVLHGELDIFDLVEPLMAGHPNLFFSFDFPSWSGGPGGAKWGSSVEGGDSADQFLVSLEHVGGVDAIADRGGRLLAERAARQPERVMWGTDRFLAWHFEAEVSAKVTEISRLLIGRLPDHLKGPFAAGNAARVLGPYLAR